MTLRSHTTREPAAKVESAAMSTLHNPRQGRTCRVQARLPDTWRIHPVVSVAHLTGTPRGVDPWQRVKEPPGRVIQSSDDVEDSEEYEIDMIVQRRVTKTKAQLPFCTLLASHEVNRDSLMRSISQITS